MTLKNRIEKLEMARPCTSEVPLVFRALVRPGPSGPIRSRVLARTPTGVVYPRDDETEEEFEQRVTAATEQKSENQELRQNEDDNL